MCLTLLFLCSIFPQDQPDSKGQLMTIREMRVPTFFFFFAVMQLLAILYAISLTASPTFARIAFEILLVQAFILLTWFLVLTEIPPFIALMSWFGVIYLWLFATAPGTANVITNCFVTLVSVAAVLVLFSSLRSCYSSLVLGLQSRQSVEDTSESEKTIGLILTDR